MMKCPAYTVIILSYYIKYRQLCQAVGAFIYSAHRVWVHSPLQIYKS